MLSRLFNSVALLILPEVQTILTFAVKVLSFLETREAALERSIEDRVVAIANTSRKRRDAISAVHKHFDKVDSKNIAAVNAARDEVTAAVNARSAVMGLLNR